jgi:hypothetical protein
MFGSQVRLPLVEINKLADREKYESIISKALAISSFPHVVEYAGDRSVGLSMNI